jgi:hypothetical protein
MHRQHTTIERISMMRRRLPIIIQGMRGEEPEEESKRLKKGEVDDDAELVICVVEGDEGAGDLGTIMVELSGLVDEGEI